VELTGSARLVRSELPASGDLPATEINKNAASKNAGKTEYIFFNAFRPLGLICYEPVSFKLQFESRNLSTAGSHLLHRSQK
jgi:hypothetical protein